MSHRATLSDLVTAMSNHMTAADLAKTTVHIQISQAIRDARRKNGWSQKELAEKMNVKQSLVSRWENNECNFTIDTLIDIADALGLSVQCPLLPDEINVSAQNTKLRTASKCTVVEEKTTFSNVIRFDPNNILNGGAA